MGGEFEERVKRAYLAAGYPPELVEKLRPEPLGGAPAGYPRLAKLYAARGYVQAALYLLELARAYAEGEVSSELARLTGEVEEVLWRLNGEIGRELARLETRQSRAQRQAERPA